MRMDKDIMSAIGNTPLVKLDNMFNGKQRLQVYAKLEMLNPGGSAKDRPALRMIREAWNEGCIRSGDFIVESSSGNMAISLAYICSRMGLKFICVIDPKTTTQNIQILKAYGAAIEYVSEPDPESGEFLPARLNRVQQLLAEIPNSFWPNQYGNENNWLSHYHTTMKEIVGELGRVDYLFGGVSTCGTIRGCAAYVRDLELATKVVAVDAEGSVIFGGKIGTRRFPGLGAGIVPPLVPIGLIDRTVYVSDWDMVAGCRKLVELESIMGGPSSGGVIMALKSMEHEIPQGSVCVVLIHDRGERYLDTVFSDRWVEEQFGNKSE